MFTTLKPVESQRRSISLWGSLGLHFGLLAWLVYPSQPLLLTPSSVAPGENGHLLTRVYWPSRTPDDSDASSPDHAETYRKQRLAHQKLTLKQAKAAKQIGRAHV